MMSTRLEQLKTKLQKIPRTSLGIFPTPLQPMPRLSQMLNNHPIYIKRDDMTGLGMGGNKTRSLEFLLGSAVQNGYNSVIASGGPQSNLCAQVAAAGARLDMNVILLHSCSSPDTLEGNLILSKLAGADMRFMGEIDEKKREERALALAEELGEQAFVVQNGASTARGALGYLNAAVELYEQSENESIDISDVIIVGAMGGTASGFIAGNALLGHPYEVHVISVEYPEKRLGGELKQLTDGTIQLLGMIPDSYVFDSVTICDEFMGPGYAQANKQTTRAAEIAASLEGIYCETVYVSKSLSGLIGLVNAGQIQSSEGICFFHTGGHPSLFVQADLFQ